MTEIPEEKLADLEDNIARGRKMKVMAETAGWKDILLPYIQGGKAGAIGSLMSGVKLEDFLVHKQAFITLGAIEQFVNNVIASGDAASETLRMKSSAGTLHGRQMKHEKV